MINCAIVDDVEKDIKTLRQIISADDRFRLFNKLIDEKNWNEEMANQQFDLLFLDIELGGKNAFDLVRLMPRKPELVIISNYPQYAMQAFEFDVVHYLQKPIKAEQVLTALERAHKRIVFRETKTVPDSFFLQTGRNKYQQIFYNKITHVSAEGEYIKFNLIDDKPILVYQRLKNIVPDLPPSIFSQIHRGTVVNTKYIKAIDGNVVILLNGEELAVGVSYKKQLIAVINR